MGGNSSKTKNLNQHGHKYGTTSSRSAARYSPYSGNYDQSKVIERVHQRYLTIGDDYNSLDQVTEALSKAGLESSNLIVGIDFTKSNEWTGRLSFHGRSLHDMDHSPNPYEQALSIIGRTLSTFDEDDLIPCFGFGDASTHDQEVFSFYPDSQPCNGFEEALRRYREIVPHFRLAGPTSFGPIIETAISIVDSSHGQYHVLLIIADGQVTRSVDKDRGQLSSQEKPTIDAIVKASKRRGIPKRICLPPPIKGHGSAFPASKHPGLANSNQVAEVHQNASAPSESSMEDKQKCPVCWSQVKNLAFGCGHQTCNKCGKDLKMSNLPKSDWG